MSGGGDEKNYRNGLIYSSQGCGAFSTPGSGMGKKSGSGSGMKNPDHISKCLETIFFGLKFLNSFRRIRDETN
jgi:hypothetical protein